MEGFVSTRSEVCFLDGYVIRVRDSVDGFAHGQRRTHYIDYTHNILGCWFHAGEQTEGSASPPIWSIVAWYVPVLPVNSLVSLLGNSLSITLSVH